MRFTTTEILLPKLHYVRYLVVAVASYILPKNGDINLRNSIPSQLGFTPSVSPWCVPAVTLCGLALDPWRSYRVRSASQWHPAN